MSSGRFVRGTAITFSARVISLALGIATSVIIARLLGPEGKGLYTLAALLPALIIAFTNLGAGPATTYHAAQRQYPLPQILGNGLLLGLALAGAGVAAGLLIAAFGQEAILPGVRTQYLLLALCIIPGSLLCALVQHVLLGLQNFRHYNLATCAHAALFLTFVAASFWLVEASVVTALVASATSWLATLALVLRWAYKASGGLSLQVNRPYLKSATGYGIKAHLGNVLTFFNYRIDMFLVNGFLNPAAVGFYSVAVGIAERLWLLSQSAGTVLFPRVAANDAGQKGNLTPLVTRTVLVMTACAAVLVLVVARPLIALLYSTSFLPAVGALQALLVGVVALSGARVLANDIAGRGRPMVNTYIALLTLAMNVGLNLLWIPRYGIIGAAWASTASYAVSLVVRAVVYTRISGKRIQALFVPQRGDWHLYKQTSIALGTWMWAKTKAIIR